MLIDLLFQLRNARIPVSITEYLAMLDGLDKEVANYSIDDFYHFSRMCLIKDERHFDRFDKVFGNYISGLQNLFDEVIGEIPEEWLRKEAERLLSEEEKKEIEALGGWDEIMDTLRKRLEAVSYTHLTLPTIRLV